MVTSLYEHRDIFLALIRKKRGKHFCRMLSDYFLNESSGLCKRNVKMLFLLYTAVISGAAVKVQIQGFILIVIYLLKVYSKMELLCSLSFTLRLKRDL